MSVDWGGGVGVAWLLRAANWAAKSILQIKKKNSALYRFKITEPNVSKFSKKVSFFKSS